MLGRSTRRQIIAGIFASLASQAAGQALPFRPRVLQAHQPGLRLIGGGATSLVSRNASSLYMPVGTGTSAGTARTWTVTLTNASGAPITAVKLALLGWYQTQTGNVAVGNDVTVTATVNYSGATTMTQAGSANITVANDSTTISDKVTLATPIPAGATYTITGATTAANGLKYAQAFLPDTIGQTALPVGLAGVISCDVPAGQMVKECLFAMGDSLWTLYRTPFLAATGKCPVLQGSISGTVGASWAKAGYLDKHVALAQALGITRVICNLGVNDLVTATVAAMQTTYNGPVGLRTQWNAGGIPYTQGTITPNTASATITPTSVTSSGTTMTLAVANASLFEVGHFYTVAGATQTEYNNTWSCTGRDTTANTVTLLFPGSSTATATGSITVKPYLNFTSRLQQTPKANFEAGAASRRALINDYIRTAGNFDDYIEFADTVEIVRNDGRWAVGGDKPALHAPFAATVTGASTALTTTSSALTAEYLYEGFTGWLQYTSGANAGQTRATFQNTAVGAINVSPDLPFAPAVGDAFVFCPATANGSLDGLHAYINRTANYGNYPAMRDTLGAKISGWLA
jgi:hypothetical protein